ncbi:MAG: nuclear transport factor 2 family protein [bacterium]|nr:nuclear transport factor 2 family protein [bacterium]
MKFLIGSIFLLTVYLVSVPAQTISLRNDQDSVLIKQLIDLEFELNDLLAERNFDTYAAYLADDYIRISADGKMKNKEQVLQQFNTTQTGKAVPEIMQIRIYGNTAIMTIRLTITTEEQGVSSIRESLLTKVFILRDGRWYMVSNQGTAIANE